MRGVDGLELDILRTKAHGGIVGPYWRNEHPEGYQAVLNLESRGLIKRVAIGPNERGGTYFRSHITPIGRIVLAASEAT